MRLESRADTLRDPETISLSIPHQVAAEQAVGFAFLLFNYAYASAEFAHGKVDPHEAGKKGGNS